MGPNEESEERLRGALVRMSDWAILGADGDVQARNRLSASWDKLEDAIVELIAIRERLETADKVIDAYRQIASDSRFRECVCQKVMAGDNRCEHCTVYLALRAYDYGERQP